MTSTSKQGESDALHARARAFIAAFTEGAAMPEAFDVLARDIAQFQARYTPGYARLCARSAVQLPFPAVPTDVFRVARVSVWEEHETPVAFRTSGTTGSRGTHWFRTCETYDAGSIAFARYALGVQERMPVIVIGPSPAEQPDSSLVHMIGELVREVGTPRPENETYFVRAGILDLAALDERIAKLLYTGVRDVLVLGTSLAYAHLLDALGEARFRLPEGVRVMQTGGFKGQTRELDATKLRKDLARAFCIEERAIVSEYGMTELSSQFWEMPRRPDVYGGPPWARVIPVDPETLAPVSDGEVGLARIEDLLNVDSAVAIVTADRVRRVTSADNGPLDAGAFELLGRVTGAPPRGCSIATDEMLLEPSRNGTS